MGNYLGAAAVLFLGAVLLGVVLQDQKIRLKAGWIALAVFIVIGLFMSTEGFKAGLLQGIFLFVLIFMVPFQIGGKLSKFRGPHGGGGGLPPQ